MHYGPWTYLKCIGVDLLVKKHILITGASRGLGYALAEKYLENECIVYACMRNVSNSACEKLKDKYKNNLHLITMDVSNTASVKNAAKSIIELTIQIDVVINNAAVHMKDSLNMLEEIDVDSCLEVYNINSLGPMRVAKELLQFLENGSMKVLVNISSEAGSIGDCKREKEFDYCMSKAALNMLSVQLQNYLVHRNIKVLSIHPGWVQTDMGGFNAHFPPSEAASNVVDLIERLYKDLNGPVYVDYSGKVMNY